MTQEDRPHRPADDTEQVYFHGSPKLRGHVGRFIGFSLVGIALMVVPFFIESAPPFVTIGGIVFGLICIIVPIILAKTIRYRVSNYRIDFERGLLSKSIDTLELWHVEDLKFHQSLIDRILRVGSITVISHDDTTPKLELHGLPNPRELFDSLKQRIIAVKRQRGVIKMDTGGGVAPEA